MNEWRRVWSTSGNSLRQLTFLLLTRIAIPFICFPYFSAPIPSCYSVGKGSDQHPVRAEFLISKRKQLCQGVPLQWIRKRDNDRFLSSQIAKWVIRNDKCLLSATWPFQYSAELWSRETVEYYCPSLRSRQQLSPFILNPTRVSGDGIKFNERNRNLGLPLKCWRDFIGKEKQRVKDLLYSIKYHKSLLQVVALTSLLLHQDIESSAVALYYSPWMKK